MRAKSGRITLNMENIFNDPKFEKILYGGVRDLDEPVGLLIYNLYKAGIKTIWSCSGHIDRFNEDAGGNALPENQVYRAGRLWYEYTSKTEILTAKLNEIVLNNNFAELLKNNEMQFTLEMQDIATPYNITGYAKKQIPIEKALARYNQFLAIWDNLTKWSEIKWRT